jgi:hypothetical protein
MKGTNSRKIKVSYHKEEKRTADKHIVVVLMDFREGARTGFRDYGYIYVTWLVLLDQLGRLSTYPRR